MKLENTTASYVQLGPDEIISSIESAGYSCDGNLFALNSYENRVYRAGLSNGDAIVAKFYRPDRWPDSAIREEHAFTIELAENSLPVVAPIANEDQETLMRHKQYRFALYPLQAGRPPELDNPGQLLELGRVMGRLHAIAAQSAFRHRPDIDIHTAGNSSSRYLLENEFIPGDLVQSYTTLSNDLFTRIQNCFERAGNFTTIRLHGDCHHGNILWHKDTPFILDFDDALTGPAVQDLWMFLSGDVHYMTGILSELLEGYTEYYAFNPGELNLIEALRTLRIINYAAWIARRWSDPAFPQAFPHFNTQHYWEDHILTLREQAAKMDEPALEWNR